MANVRTVYVPNIIFNNYSYKDKVTIKDYSSMLKNIAYSLLPEGIKFEYK